MARANGCKRIFVNVPEGLHKELKEIAVQRYTSISKLVLRMIVIHIIEKRKLNL